MSVDPDIIDAQWKPVDPRTWRTRVRGTVSPAENLPRGTSTGRSPPAGQTNILADRWPILAAAMNRYQQNVAEEYTSEAYHRINSGIIRFDDRKKLASRAAELNIRPFDAQLLIACAVRQWSLDQAKCSAAPERRTNSVWRRSKWSRFGLLIALAAALDAVLLWTLHV